MENASEALMMAFGVLIFVLALTVAINSFNQVKSVSDVVLYTKDETNYYDYQGATGKASESRVVGLETIIPTLYKYYNENYTVLFRQGTYLKNEEGEYTGDFGDDLRPLYVYTTSSRYKTENGRTYLWGKEDENYYLQSTYDTLMQEKYSIYFSNGYNGKGNTSIFSFDLEEETLRREPWAGIKEQTKLNLDCFLNGNVYDNPRKKNEEYIDYGKLPLGIGGFIGKYKNKHFIETIGEYVMSDTQRKASYANDKYRRRVGKHN